MQLATSRLRKDSRTRDNPRVTIDRVTFTVSLGPNSYEGLTGLSGGEGDRLSITLTLAFHRLSRFPLLILDKSLSSLDNSHRAQIMTMLSQEGIATLAIVHDVNEGIFDVTSGCW